MSGSAIKTATLMPVRFPGLRPWTGGWNGWTCSADPSKYATSPARRWLSRCQPMLRGQMSSVSAPFAMAISFESKAGFSINNDLSWRHSCATTDDRLTGGAARVDGGDPMGWDRAVKILLLDRI